MNKTGVNAIIMELAVSHDPQNSSKSIIEVSDLLCFKTFKNTLRYGTFMDDAVPIFLAIVLF